jgi:hypothetical protein
LTPPGLFDKLKVAGSTMRINIPLLFMTAGTCTKGIPLLFMTAGTCTKSIMESVEKIVEYYL